MELGIYSLEKKMLTEVQEYKYLHTYIHTHWYDTCLHNIGYQDHDILR